MELLYTAGGYKAERIVGRIGSLGPSQTQVQRQFGETTFQATTYSNIRFETANSHEMVKNILAFELVESYLQPGLEAEFFLVRKKDGTNGSIVAMRIDGKLVDEFETWRSMMLKAVNGMGLLIFLMVISVIFSPLALLMIFSGSSTKRTLKALRNPALSPT